MQLCYGAIVQRQRVTYSIDRSLLRAARVAAARQDRRESELVEDALRSYLAIGVLEEIWSHAPGDLGDDEALAFAVDEQHAARRDG